jgi:hypothetical protein
VEKYLSPTIHEVSGFPLAQIGLNKPLTLQGGIKHIWTAPMPMVTFVLVAKEKMKRIGPRRYLQTSSMVDEIF